MYPHIRFITIACLLVSASTLQVSAQPQASLPPLPETYFPALGSILETALQQSPKMVYRNTEAMIAEANRITARAGLLPTLGTYVTYYPLDRQQRAVAPSVDPKGYTISNVKQFNYSVFVTQPVLHWGALKYNAQIGELQLKISQGMLADAYRTLASEIRSQYLGLIVRKASLAKVQFARDVADDDLRLARSKLEKRVIAEADMFSPTIAAEQARLIADHNQSDYDNARVLFGRLCGTPPISDQDVPTEIPAVSPATSSLLALVGRSSAVSKLSTYALENAKRAIEVEKLNYRIARTRLRPKLNLIIGVSQSQVSYSLDPGARYQVRDYYAGGTFNWTIFDGFATKAAKSASLLRRQQLERTYEEQSGEFRSGLRQQMTEIEFSARNLAIVEKLLASSDAYMVIKTEDQKRGLASESELQSARLGLKVSQINAYNARAEYLMKVTEYVSAIQMDPVLMNLPAKFR